jgi:hypothetical protein
MNTIDTIALSLWILLAGVVCGFLANILVSRGAYKSKWMWLFYGLGVVSLGISLWDTFKNGNLYVTYTGIGVSVVFFPILYFMTHPRERFSTKQLNPKIIKFTSDADDELLRLFFGDINCFGELPGNIDLNPQYNQLKQLQFRKLQILCERPQRPEQKTRYGKVLTDFQGVQMKHYNGTTARDVGIRGRIKKFGQANVDKIQLYKVIRENGNKFWEAVEHDVNHSDCTLYVKLWELLWDNADPAAAADITEWKRLYSP